MFLNVFLLFFDGTKYEQLNSIREVLHYHVPFVNKQTL